jgi:hypothetical protein
MQQMQFKIGLWYLINIYPQDEQAKQAVLKYVLGLDQLFDMEKMLVASFYTYSFLDPEAGTLVDGKPQIHHPDILENKLAVVRELSRKIQAHRMSETGSGQEK